MNWMLETEKPLPNSLVSAFDSSKLAVHLPGDIAPGGGQQIADLMDDEIDILIRWHKLIRHLQDLTFLQSVLLYDKTPKTQAIMRSFCYQCRYQKQQALVRNACCFMPFQINQYNPSQRSIYSHSIPKTVS